MRLLDPVRTTMGMIQYDDDSASRYLYPACEGGKAIVQVMDYTEDSLKTTEALVREARARCAKLAQKHRIRSERDAARMSDEEVRKTFRCYPSAEYPVVVWLSDAALKGYDCAFRTLAEAQEAVALMRTCQPLNHERDVVPMGFRPRD